MRELMRQTRLRNVFLLRGAAIWVGVRFMLGLAKVGNPNPVLEGMVLGVVGGLVWWDARRRNEDLFLANLGVPGWAIALLGALGALPLEVLVP